MSGCTPEQPDCGPCGGEDKGVTWKIQQGAYFKRRLKIRKLATGGSFNLTGYGVRCYFRRVKFTTAADQTATATCTIIDAATGRVDVTLGASVTRMMWDTGYFDVEVYKIADAEEVYRVHQGAWAVDLEVTTA